MPRQRPARREVGAAEITAFGAAIRTFRETRNITLRDFARMAGTSPSYLSSLENGPNPHMPSVARAVALARVARIPPKNLWQFFTDRPDTPAEPPAANKE